MKIARLNQVGKQGNGGKLPGAPVHASRGTDADSLARIEAERLQFSPVFAGEGEGDEAGSRAHLVS